MKKIIEFLKEWAAELRGPSQLEILASRPFHDFGGPTVYDPTIGREVLVYPPWIIEPIEKPETSIESLARMVS